MRQTFQNAISACMRNDATFIDDCTILSTSLEVTQGVLGAYAFVRGSSSALNFLEPSLQQCVMQLSLMIEPVGLQVCPNQY